MRRKHPALSLALSAACFALAGCALQMPGPVVSLPTPPETGKPEAEKQETGGIPSASEALKGVLKPEGLVVGTSTEVYTRIARGVLTCWFGASGPLKASYIYHAEAEPQSMGGSSEIKILTRDTDTDAEDPRALRAYRITIAPSGGQARVETENVRLPEPLAARLKADVERWSGDEAGCGEGPVTAGWTAAPAVAKPVSLKQDEKNKKP
ncbi:MAG: hypothetical protein AB7J30_00965 [Hyphomicrobium sp.]|uniref:hypothetical protein n=1 Tax=Hyphomicrobium sp. TaxID=82 RepID=UPI003D0A14EB